MSNTNEGWFPDPMGRHQYRFWSGNAWTEHVSDNGIAGVDPLGPPAPPVANAGFNAPAANPVSQPYQMPVAGQAMAYPQGYVPPPLVAKSNVAIFAVVGAIVAGISTALNWLDIGGSTANGFDVPIVYLFDYKTTADGGGFSLGVLMLLLSAGALVIGFVPKPGLRMLGRSIGGLLTMCGVLYVISTQRAVNSFNESGFGLMDALGIAPWFAIVGGVLVSAGSRK